MSNTAWQRIHIIGIPGSGKSTLALRCSAAFGIPVFDLDYLALEEPSGIVLHGSQRYEASQAAARRLAQQGKWVSEGIYCGWTESLLERADVIIWLDTRTMICVWRIILRHARRSLAHDKDYPGLRLLGRFAWGVLRDGHRPAATFEQLRADMNRNSRATTAVHLGPWRDKVLRCHTGRDRARLMYLLTAGRNAERGIGAPDAGRELGGSALG